MKLWIILAALVLGSAVVSFLPIIDLLQQLSTSIEQGGWWGALLMVLVIGIWNMLFPPLPWQVLAGYCYGFALAAGVIYAGTTIAMIASLYLARGALRATIEAKLTDRPRWRALDAAISRKGWKAVLLLRLSNILPSNIANYACGLTTLSVSTVVFASWIGKAPGIAFSILIGASLRQAGEGLDWTAMAGLGIGVVATLTMAWTLGRESRRQLISERSTDVQAPLDESTAV